MHSKFILLGLLAIIGTFQMVKSDELSSDVQSKVNELFADKLSAQHTRRQEELYSEEYDDYARCIEMLEDFDAKYTDAATVKIESVHPSCKKISFKRHYYFSSDGITGLDIQVARVGLGAGDSLTIVWDNDGQAESKTYTSDVENDSLDLTTTGFYIEYITGSQPGWGFELDVQAKVHNGNVQPTFVKRRSFLSKHNKRVL
mmetsp:Transcript_50666/g.58084  ORF Transcript_50666/g.58084 Transcript_50666/m.58084 type:complete len:201 (+) Transcript_50666:15-617(+)